jgi:hypothetical protein
MIITKKTNYKIQKYYNNFEIIITLWFMILYSFLVYAFIKFIMSVI